MKIKITNKKSVNIGKFEINANDKIYIVYVFPKCDYSFSEFYITQEDNSIMSFCVGVQQEDIKPSLEEFINDNITKWINDFDVEADIVNCLF